MEQFQVRQNLEYVEKYSKPDAFQYLDILEADRMIAHLARLMPPSDGDEYARRFDVVMFQIILAKIDGNTDKFNSFVRTVKRAAASLEQKATIPEVIAAKDTLAKAKSDTFWQTATLLHFSIDKCTSHHKKRQNLYFSIIMAKQIYILYITKN